MAAIPAPEALMEERFYMLRLKYLDCVRGGTITAEELGHLCCLALLVNPHNGYCLTNFTMLAAELNEKRARVEYVFNKLKFLRLVYFEMYQGKRSKCPFFVMGLEMWKPKGAPARIVTPEYIAKAVNYSEVILHFQKSKAALSTVPASSNEDSKRMISEVAYIQSKEDEDKKMAASQPRPIQKGRVKCDLSEDKIGDLTEAAKSRLYNEVVIVFQVRGWMVENGLPLRVFREVARKVKEANPEKIYPYFKAALKRYCDENAEALSAESKIDRSQQNESISSLGQVLASMQAKSIGGMGQ